VARTLVATLRFARRLAIAAAGLAAIGLVGCGDVAPTPVVRVGETSIGKRTLEHWTSVIARGAAVPIPASAARQPPRQQALAFLISSDWLLGEAAEQGMKLSERQLARRVAEQRESAGSGSAEFQATLAATGETSSDVSFEVAAEWAQAKIRQLLLARATKIARTAVSASGVASYYKRHIDRYRHAEYRYFDIIEGLRSPAIARALAARIGAGRRFYDMAFHESHARPRAFDEPDGKGPLFRSIFSARIGAIGGPMWLNHGWVIYVVRRIRPASVQPLAAVRRSIEALLIARARRRADAAAAAAYVRRWTARTDCHPRYVVRKCRQYHGAPAPEGDDGLTSAG
jgi:hypothetical protein